MLYITIVAIMYNLIVARNKNNGIGYGDIENNIIPWHNPDDLALFKKMTIGNIIIMGYNTFKSLKYQPLPNRINVVITHHKIDQSNNLLIFDSISECNKILSLPPYDTLIKWVIGGECIYNQYMKLGILNEVYISEINNTSYTNKSFNWFSGNNPEIGFKLIKSTNYNKFIQNHYRAVNTEEINLLNHMNNIIKNGFYKSSRTGVNTYSSYGNMFTYMINEKFTEDGIPMYSIPLLTTKKMFLRGIFEELKWFLNGGVNSKELESKKVNIWKGNTTKDYLNKYNLSDYQEGECGPIYGFQWKHWGANYIPGKFNYENEGIDQVSSVINSLKTDPYSRRHIISGWNVSDLNKMCLPPCFVKDSMVLTNSGYKYIQNVKDSDFLYTHKANYENIVNIQNKQYSGNLYTIKSALNDIKISATKEHPFLVKTKIMVSLEPRQYKLSKPKWIEARNLDITKHVLCIPINKNSEEISIDVRVNNTTVFKQSHLTENDYYMLGYYLGTEGSILKMQIKPPSWSLLQEFDNDQDVACIIPKWVFDLSVKNICIFLNGFISSKQKNDLGFISVKNYEIALSLQLLFGKVGKIINILLIENEYVIRIDSNNNYKFPVIDEGYICSELIDIKKAYVNDIKVYNFEVSNDSSYTIENIAVHNCHMLYQFLVHSKNNDKYLTLMMTQRSCDTFLGLPFNIASLGLFLILMAQQVNMKPYKIIHSIADMHIYESHIDAVNIQLNREPYLFPYISINNKKDKIENYEFVDIKLHNYNHHSIIKAPMSA